VWEDGSPLLASAVGLVMEGAESPPLAVSVGELGADGSWPSAATSEPPPRLLGVVSVAGCWLAGLIDLLPLAVRFRLVGCCLLWLVGVLSGGAGLGLVGA
jgi:hypothetical protein